MKEWGTGISSPTPNNIQRDDNNYNNYDNNNNNYNNSGGGGGGNVNGIFFLYVGSGEGDNGGWFGGRQALLLCVSYVVCFSYGFVGWDCVFSPQSLPRDDVGRNPIPPQHIPHCYTYPLFYH